MSYRLRRKLGRKIGTNERIMLAEIYSIMDPVTSSVSCVTLRGNWEGQVTYDPEESQGHTFGTALFNYV
jgi:hypothetical protein